MVIVYKSVRDSRDGSKLVRYKMEGEPTFWLQYAGNSKYTLKPYLCKTAQHDMHTPHTYKN